MWSVIFENRHGFIVTTMHANDTSAQREEQQARDAGCRIVETWSDRYRNVYNPARYGIRTIDLSSEGGERIDSHMVREMEG